jgi:hypothetical protein
MADETKRVDVFMGPYRGNLLTMPVAEADAAIAAHWARDPFSGEEYGKSHPPLSEQERTDAMTAATAWAQAQWAPPPTEPKPAEPRAGARRQPETQAGPPR